MSLPTFFGRATAASTQHLHLAALLRELDAACETLVRQETPVTSDMTRLLGELELEMQGHFLAEEADGYFGTLASELPELLPTIAELRADHTRMLEAVGELRLLVEDPTRGQDLARLSSSLREQFKAHERIEAELVRSFLMRDTAVTGG
jgi:hypothetical protein